MSKFLDNQIHSIQSSPPKMQLSLGAILKSTFQLWAKKPQAEISQIRSENHDYIRGDIANRGPCPGLNALANHGYL